MLNNYLMLAVAVVELVSDDSDIVPCFLIHVDCIDFRGLIQESEETQLPIQTFIKQLMPRV